MKKLMMGLGLVVLTLANSSVFGKTDKVFEAYKQRVEEIKFDKNMDAKFLSLIELCHLKKYSEGSKSGLNEYINSKYTSQKKKDQLNSFKNYIDDLIKTGETEYLSGIKSTLVERIKKINANASCLK